MLDQPRGSAPGFSLSLGHFFAGMMDREEVASAFLAMALEGVPSFRDHFFTAIAPSGLEQVPFDRTWRVSVEQDRVDIRMETEDAVVLIENKLRPGSRQHEQLLRYFREACTGDRPRILVVYLAPGAMGTGEVAAVQQCAEYNPQLHRAVQVPWEQLYTYVPGDHPYEHVVADGLSHIKRITEKAGPVYVGEGARGEIRKAVAEAWEILTPMVSIGFHQWSSQYAECLRSIRTNITVVFCAAFEADEAPPYLVRNVIDESGRFMIRLTSGIRLASAARNPELKKWWNEQLAKSHFEVPGVGTYHLSQNREFLFSRSLHGSAHDVATQLAEAASTAANWLEDLLAEDGFHLALHAAAEVSSESGGK
jgi:hypothetical protein